MSMSKCSFAPMALLLVAAAARADTLADWADKTTEIATDGPNTIRTMALAQNAVYEAVNAITSRYPRDRLDLGQAAGASIDAAIAAASWTVLLHEAPMLKPQTDAAYDKSLHAMPDDDARVRGVNIGVRAAQGVLAKHTDDLGNPEPYRPVTTPGVFVLTTFPLGVAVSQPGCPSLKKLTATGPSLRYSGVPALGIHGMQHMLTRVGQTRVNPGTALRRTASSGGRRISHWPRRSHDRPAVLRECWSCSRTALRCGNRLR
jgi:hypothetical protein